MVVAFPFPPPPYFIDVRQVYGLSEGSSICWARRKVLAHHIFSPAYITDFMQGHLKVAEMSTFSPRDHGGGVGLRKVVFVCLLSAQFPAPTFSDSLGYYCLDYLPGVIIL